MVWFMVDDNLGEHPKVNEAGIAAMGLWVICGSWSARYLTEGFIPEWYVLGKPDGGELAQRLVEAELWHPTVKEGKRGWLFHEWEANGQRSRAQVEHDRQMARERQQRRRRNAQGNGVTPTVTPGGDSSRESHDPSLYQANTNTKEQKSKNTPSPKARVSAAFAEFWGVYPRKVGKADAERKFEIATRTVDPVKILAGARVYAASVADVEARFVKHPGTWLHQGCWDDEADRPRVNGHVPEAWL